MRDETASAGPDNGVEAEGLVAEDTEFRAAGRRLNARWIRPARREGATATATATATAIVFLHEGLGSIGQWADFPEAVVARTGLPALIYERWGYGGSDPFDGPVPVDWMEREALEALPEVLAQAGIARPLLFGHSDGGTIALIYGAHHSCAGIVTEAAHIYQDDLTHAGQAYVRAQLDKGGIQPLLAPYHGPRAEALVEAWLAHWGSEDKRGWDIRFLLPRIACPLLAIQGDRDRFGEPRQLDDIVAGAGGPAEKLFLEDCGHVPHLQARERVMEKVAGFVEEIIGRARATD